MRNRPGRALPVMALVLATPGQATELTCADPWVRVSAVDSALARATCDIATRALVGLDACNVRLGSMVEIVVKDHLPDDCMGLYHCGTNRIDVLAPSTLEDHRRDDSIFVAIPNEAYFASIVTHELAHAAFDDVPCLEGTCMATSEYVAYAMQINALPIDLRATVATRDPGAPPIARDDLSPMLALFAPDIFAVKAWLHFSQRPDPCAYMGQIMEGTIRFDRERP